ncbi:MAG TPA: enoyl-CoA hydratase-related protein [Polyangia bacterium]|nr:enoyl-CoA hydratase-related protein [Polyangia bacterium]
MVDASGSGGVIVDAGGAVATVTIDRPQARNALDEATLRELLAAFEGLSASPLLRCVILTGAGDKAFVAGADIKQMAGLGPREARAFAELGHDLGDAIEALRTPVIAAVGGYALGGGCELALACDFIYASSTAHFGQPEVNLGVMPGFGGTQRLARRVGIGRARELIYTGAIITAEEALRIGLCNAVVEPAHLLARVRAVADTIASKGPLAIADAKRAMRRGADMPLAEAHELERHLFAGLFATADQKEGMAAFLEKRAPKFQGR